MKNLLSTSVLARAVGGLAPILGGCGDDLAERPADAGVLDATPVPGTDAGPGDAAPDGGVSDPTFPQYVKSLITDKTTDKELPQSEAQITKPKDSDDPKVFDGFF